MKKLFLTSFLIISTLATPTFANTTTELPINDSFARESQSLIQPRIDDTITKSVNTTSWVEFVSDTNWLDESVNIHYDGVPNNNIEQQIYVRVKSGNTTILSKTPLLIGEDTGFNITNGSGYKVEVLGCASGSVTITVSDK